MQLPMQSNNFLNFAKIEVYMYKIIEKCILNISTSTQAHEKGAKVRPSPQQVPRGGLSGLPTPRRLTLGTWMSWKRPREGGEGREKERRTQGARGSWGEEEQSS